MRTPTLLPLAGVLMACSQGVTPPTTPLHPGIEAELAQPFCYFLVNHDVIGFKNAPQGSHITPDGAFATTFLEVRLGLGPAAEPYEPRIRTLHRGYLPILESATSRGGANFAVQAFALPPRLDPRAILVNGLRVSVDNPGDEPLDTQVQVRIGDKGDKNRAKLACVEWYCAQFIDADQWASTRDVRLEGREVFRAGHLVLRDLSADAPELIRAEDGEVVLRHTLSLAPGERRDVDIVFPTIPVAPSRAEVLADVRDLGDHATRLQTAIDFWEQELHLGMVVRVDEPKVVDTMRAGLAYNLIARDIEPDGVGVVQKVGELMYDRFYPRDAGYFARTFNMLGRPDLAREVVDNFLVDGPDGAPASILRLEPDDWGQSLWALGAHARATDDDAFAALVAPLLGAHLDELEAALASDPLGVWPEEGSYDNERLEGHYTGHNFWALLGLEEAAGLYQRAGDSAGAARASAIRAAYLERFLTALAVMTDETGGYVPPGLDDPRAGYDWANAGGGVYPFGLFAPDDPRVTATLETLRPHFYQEGVMTYGATNAFAAAEARAAGQTVDTGYLHHYLTMYVTQTLLARGEQAAVLEDFYAILAHTGSAHGGFEFHIPPYGSRDPTWNRPPHGWFAARYNELLRNMLVREVGSELHLLTVLSPVWLAPDKSIEVERAGTDFGGLDLTLDADSGGATLALAPDFRRAPDALVVHVPFWVSLETATATDEAGEPLAVAPRGDALVVPASTRELRLDWSWGAAPDISYDKAVARFLELYYERPADADYRLLLRAEP